MTYIPHTPADRRHMLDALNLADVEQLFEQIPASVRLQGELDIPPAMDEMQLRAYFEALAGRNTQFEACFRGAGAYRHYIPAVVARLASRSEFYTSYTPYQPEISQGGLQVIYEFQSMICALTGMDAANASVYDGATAAVEAAAMCVGRGRDVVLASAALNPQVIDTLRTWAGIAGHTVRLVPERDGLTDLDALQSMLDASTACVIAAQPNFFGQVEGLQPMADAAHAAGAKLVACCHPIALAVLKSPGECGADIAVGEGQPLGNSLNFGGPYLGFMACRGALMRKLPGRIAGETMDGQGRRGFVLTLQAREQHIRREKASSNICTNQALNALCAAVYMAAMGPQGLKQAALLSMKRAQRAAKAIAALPGMSLRHTGAFFNEFVVDSQIDPQRIEAHLIRRGILGGLPLPDGRGTLYCCTEMNTDAQIDQLLAALAEVCQP